MKKHFTKKQLDPKKYRKNEVLVRIARIPLTPIFLLVRIYYWVWDYDYTEHWHK